MKEREILMAILDVDEREQMIAFLEENEAFYNALVGKIEACIRKRDKWAFCIHMQYLRTIIQNAVATTNEIKEKEFDVSWQ